MLDWHVEITVHYSYVICHTLYKCITHINQSGFPIWTAEWAKNISHICIFQVQVSSCHLHIALAQILHRYWLKNRRSDTIAEWLILCPPTLSAWKWFLAQALYLNCIHVNVISEMAACGWMNNPLLSENSSVSSWACPLHLLLEAILYSSLSENTLCCSLLAEHSLTVSTETVKIWFIISWGHRSVHCQAQTFI